MFTGIIESTGRVLSVRKGEGGVRLRLEGGGLTDGLKLGASVAVSGVCLTVCHIESNLVDFDVIRETLDRSTLGRLRVGDRVNLERSLVVGDRLDGHFVQGHVDGQARLRQRIASGEEFVLWLVPDSPLAGYMVPKGSVAVDGVSLTIAETRAGEFSVALIPTTVERTTLGERREGDAVNIETDILVRTILHRMGPLQTSNGLMFEKLAEAGYT